MNTAPAKASRPLDPELLSNLFERLIVPTQKGSQSPLRQPQGTYYTPADVADEMVKDALSAAVKDDAGPLNDAQILNLFGDSDTPLPNMRPAAKQRLAGRIRELRIFDPAVGSGEFLFSTLLALRRALKKLADADESAEAIIKRQLRGQDINPLAVQIARLRLFIAITAARRRDSAEPLPNLEAVIVCADTLETVADPQWRSAQLDMADPEIGQAVAAVAETRALWFDANSEEAKHQLLSQYSARRDHLELLLQQKGELASPELRELVKVELIGHAPARTDARLLFHQTPWQGFDVVIGNPPYEALSRSMTKETVNALKSGKRYQTTNVADLYSLFCETSLALAKPDGGVVTLIVPLSVSFGQQQRTLRDAYENCCREINLRQYNNNPSMMFHLSPTMRDPRNRQRVTVITAVLGDTANQEIRSTGLQRWSSEERNSCLNQRKTSRIPQLGSNINWRVGKQWPRVPTEEVADMVRTVISQQNSFESYKSSKGINVAFPVASEYFISVFKEGKITPRTEQTLTVDDDDALRLIMALFNGHIAYAWWWMFGDGFHVKLSDFAGMTIPDAWAETPQPAIDIGQRMIDAMPECEVEITIHQKTWRNVNFYQKPELIDELDRLHIAALGLPEEPLLTHLRMMRSSSSWNYTPA